MPYTPRVFMCKPCEQVSYSIYILLPIYFLPTLSVQRGFFWNPLEPCFKEEETNRNKQPATRVNPMNLITNALRDSYTAPSPLPTLLLRHRAGKKRETQTITYWEPDTDRSLKTQQSQLILIKRPKENGLCLRSSQRYSRVWCIKHLTVQECSPLRVLTYS